MARTEMDIRMELIEIYTRIGTIADELGLLEKLQQRGGLLACGNILRSLIEHGFGEKNNG